MTKINELVDGLAEDQLQDLMMAIRTKQQAIEERRLSTPKFPLEADLYLHSSKEDNYHTAEMLGLNEQQSQAFRYTAYEVKLSIRIMEDGTAVLHSVQDVRLTHEIKI